MAEIGRPTVMKPEAIAKLEEAFSNGASDLEACFYANIGKDSLYRYQKEHPEFSERKEALKEFIKYQAKKNIKMKIESGDTEISKWYLERKAKKEFGNNLDLTSEGEKIDGFNYLKPNEANDNSAS